MALIDTSALIDFARGVRGAVRAVKSLEEREEAILVATVTLFELAAGSPPGIDEKRKALVQALQVTAFSYDHAEKAGTVYRQLRDNGTEIGPIDAMIAATALCENQPLLTANEKHFKRVQGLQVITY